MKSAALVLALLAALTACGGDDTPTATDPPESSPESETFDGADYTYTLRVNCFCSDGGVPISVTVRDGEVVDAVYARKGRGHAAGDQVDKWRRLTIEDIIDEADKARANGAAEVDVAWPDGQDHPDSVSIDQDRRMADEEIGYEISNVSPQS